MRVSGFLPSLRGGLESRGASLGVWSEEELELILLDSFCGEGRTQDQRRETEDLCVRVSEWFLQELRRIGKSGCSTCGSI